MGATAPPRELLFSLHQEPILGIVIRPGDIASGLRALFAEASAGLKLENCDWRLPILCEGGARRPLRAVVQRVLEAFVRVGEEEVARIGPGLLVFVGVGPEDSLDDVRSLTDKVARLRVFPDDEDKMNRSVLDIGGGVLVVSQFTLMGDCRKGRRPSYAGAAGPGLARSLYDAFIEHMRAYPVQVASGRFQETMRVHLVNDGPVTLLLDSRKLF